MGYSKHPFLTAWLCAGITQLFGTVGWPVYLLAQLAIAITFIATWKLAQLILPALHALIAALLLEGVLFYNINSFNFTPDTLQSPLWALLSLFFYKAVTTQRLKHWLSAALFAALCLCTKYQAVLLFFPLFLFCLVNPQARTSFTKPGIYCALILFFLLMTPHLIWLYHHDFITLTYAAEIPADYTTQKTILSHFTYPARFLINNFIDVLGLFILLCPFYMHKEIAPKSQPSLTIFNKQFLFFTGLGPLILSLMLCFISGDYFPPRWSTPYFFTLGIIAMAYLKPAISKKQIKQFAIILILFSSLLFITRMITLSLYPRPESDAFLPNKTIAMSLSRLWEKEYHTKLPYLAGSHYLVALITPYMPDNPKPYLSWDQKDSPWIDELKIHKQGGLFIWDAGGIYAWDKDSRDHATLSESVLTHFPKLRILENLTFYNLANKHPIVIGVAILPPES